MAEGSVSEPPNARPEDPTSAPREAARGTISIRESLFRNLGLLILGLSAAIVGITWWTARQAAEAASAQLIEVTLDRSQAELRGFFDPITRNLETARHWFATGLVAPDDTESLNRLFVPLLDTHPQISAVHWGDDEGRGWMLLRMGDRWRNRRVDPTRTGPTQRFREWSRQGGRVRTWTAADPSPEQRYDPRERPWYRIVVGSDAGRGDADPTIYWTEPYHFFTTGQPGLTAATRVRTPDGQTLVLAVDVLLADITAFTQTLTVSPRGFVGILASDRRVVALPGLPAFDDPRVHEEAFLKHPEELGVDVLSDAVRARIAAGWPVAETAGPSGGIAPVPGRRPPLRFESGGEAWWAGGHVVEVPPDRVFAVVVAVPEADLLGPLRQLPAGVGLAAAVALGVAIWMALRLAGRYGRPLAQLAANSERIRHLDLGQTRPVVAPYSEVSQLARSQEGMRSALDSFSRYVPTDVVRELLDRGDAARIGGTRQTLTVLFSDVAGFTSIAERMSPEAITDHMADYFEQMIEIIDATGTVDKLVGDGIMAFWGAPLPDPDHARHAVEATLVCLEHLEKQNPRWVEAGRPALPTRFGLACGPALVGNVGAPRRLSYTAVGDAVNLASRLEGLNRLYGTSALAADPVPVLAGEGFVWREVDRVRVVGRSQAVDIHELLGRRDAVPAETRAFARQYAEALALYRARSFDDARRVLDGVEPVRRRNDLSVRRLRQACTRFLRTAPPDDWEGVTILETK